MKPVSKAAFSTLSQVRAIVLSVVGVVLSNPVQASDAAMALIPASERKPAPSFTLANLQGEPVTLLEYKGRVVLLNFWATWCLPCRQEMPGMQSVWQTYQAQGLTVLAVSIDTVAPERIAKFVKKLQLSFPILLDAEDQASSLYRVSGLPASFLLDRDGRVASVITGSREWSNAESLTVIEQLLAN